MKARGARLGDALTPVHARGSVRDESVHMIAFESV